MTNIFGSGLTVPRGKIVRFNQRGNTLLYGYEFYLEEDIMLKFSSTFQPLVDASINSAFVLITESANEVFKASLPSAGFKQLGFQQWAGTEPLSFSFQVKRFVEESAYRDVVVPFKLLAKISVPTQLDNTGSLQAPGPTALDVIFDKQNRKVNKGSLTIQIGSITLSSCVIQDVEPTFSRETDEDGYPIWVSMRISGKTIFTANDRMVDELFPISAGE